MDTGSQLVVRCVDGRMTLLLPKGRLAPAEVRHQFGAVRERLPGPETRHARFRYRVIRRPVDWTDLLFHHPHASVAHATVQIVVESGYVGMTGAGPTVLLSVVEPQHFRARQRITVPCGDIETAFGKLVVIEAREKAHEVMQQI